MNKHATSPEKSHNYSLPVVSLSSGLMRCRLMFNWVCHKPDDPDVKPGVAQPDVGVSESGLTPMCARCAHA